MLKIEKTKVRARCAICKTAETMRSDHIRILTTLNRHGWTQKRSRKNDFIKVICPTCSMFK
jgi:hypothetical protein